MKVQQLMTPIVGTCGPGDNLAAVAMTMWRQDCGVVPVVNEERKVLGMITDRDICMATATRHRAPEQLEAHEVMGPRLIVVRPEDDAHTALAALGKSQVRRLPVVDSDSRLVGIVSINDFILHAEPTAARARAAIPMADVLETLKAICTHPPLRTVAPKHELATVG
jgi:CBS domain-containing protein